MKPEDVSSLLALDLCLNRAREDRETTQPYRSRVRTSSVVTTRCQIS